MFYLPYHFPYIVFSLKCIFMFLAHFSFKVILYMKYTNPLLYITNILSCFEYLSVVLLEYKDL
jgi:hypothetical protein